METRWIFWASILQRDKFLDRKPGTFIIPSSRPSARSTTLIVSYTLEGAAALQFFPSFSLQSGVLSHIEFLVHKNVDPGDNAEIRGRVAKTLNKAAISHTLDTKQSFLSFCFSFSVGLCLPNNLTIQPSTCFVLSCQSQVSDLLLPGFLHLQATAIIFDSYHL